MRKEGEREEEKEQQGRIREKKREEQWESVRGRELIAEDWKRSAELGGGLEAELKRGTDDWDNKKGVIGLKDNLGLKMAMERCLVEQRERRQD